MNFYGIFSFYIACRFQRENSSRRNIKLNMGNNNPRFPFFYAFFE